ncbi:MAG: hypothetical protein VX444_12860 [Pseudomonadota bacterium]|nr:hypothetical protein [Pseudomonadota bacterium]
MRKPIIGAAVLAVAMITGQGLAAATCADRDHVTTQLAQQFGEAPVANQISHSNRILEVFASPGAKTWSIVITLPERNLSCLAATGKGRAPLKRTLGSL